MPLVQSDGQDAGGAGTGTTFAYPSNVTAGNLLTYMVRLGGDTTLTVTSNRTSGNWAVAHKSAVQTDDGSVLVTVYAIATSSGACTVTFAFGASVTSRYEIAEYDNINTTTPFDKATSSQSGGTTSTAPVTGSQTPTNPNSLIIGVVTTGGDPTTIAANGGGATGYTLREAAKASNRIAFEDKTLTSSSAQTAGFTLGSGQTYIVAILIFNTVAAGGIAANAADVATASAALSTQIKLGAAAADVTTVAAAVTTAIRLAAAAIDTATASAAFASGAVLQGAALDVATATAALSTAIRANGQAADVATANGTLTNWASVTLSGTLYTGQGGALDPNFWLDSIPQLGATLYYDATHITIYPNGEISSDVANCAAVVQFFDGADWALGLVVFTDQLAAIAKDVASSSAAMSTAINLAAAANALATATAAFSTGAGLGATATDTAAASGALTTKIPLSALATDVATAVGALTAQIKLAATPADVATATAALNSIIGLQAAASSVAAASASLTTLITPAANAQAQATGTASLTTAIKASASAADIASAAASLNAAILLVAQAADAASSSAALTTSRPLVAAAIDVANSIAILSTGIKLSANDVSIAQATAALTAGIAIFADAASQATATAVLTDIIESPPVDAYQIDSRYVISRSMVDPAIRRTPRFITKDPLDRCVLGFDFSDQLDEGETLVGKITMSVAAIAGNDPSATALLVGVPSYVSTYTQILQPIFGGLDGCKYYIKVSAATTNPNKVVSLAGLLPVAS
jgi:hypothetical protein